MRRVLLVLFSAVAILLAVMVARTLRLPAAPPPVEDAGPAITLAPDEAAARLAGAVRFPTVSYAPAAPIDTAAFLGLHQYLADQFPGVATTLRREVVGGLSLLYTWVGADSTLDPVVLMGHLDVVPVPESGLADWRHAPFAGDLADGYVWGRGTMDDKVTVLAILEAVEGLIRDGYRPPRTVVLAFGHDEEVGGLYGARAIVNLLVSRGVRPALVLDEGGVIAENTIPGLPGRAAIVGIAEKGYVSFRLTARAEGGHSSMPPGRTAVGTLSQAITALEASPFPSSLSGPTEQMLAAMAPYLPFSRRMALANLWLTRPFVIGMLQGSPLGAALLHTTTSPTMLSAGVKDNVLPPEATAVVNFRIFPGETVGSVRERVERVINDSAVTVAALDSAGVDPSPVSEVGSPAWNLIDRSIRQMAPGERIPVLPYLVMGGTDAKYWSAHSDRVFRFLAVPLRDGDVPRIHGVNERVAVDDYSTAIAFFARLLRGLDTL